MNKNSIIGLTLIFLLMMGYTYFISPSAEELAQRRHIQDSTLRVQRMNDSLLRLREQQATAPVIVPDSTAPADTAAMNEEAAGRYGKFASAVSTENRDIIVESDLLRITVSTLGGRISQVELKDFKTFDGKPVILFTPDSSEFNLGFFSENRTINTSELTFTPFVNGAAPGEGPLQVNGDGKLELTMRLQPQGAENAVIDYVYTIPGNSYLLGFDLKFANLTGIVDDNTRQLNGNWNAYLHQQEKNLKNERNNSTVFYRFTDGEIDNVSLVKSDKKTLPTRVNWISFKQQFFSSTIISTEVPFENTEVEVVKGDEKETAYLQTNEAHFSLPFNPQMPDNTYHMNLYFGPNKYKIMRSMDLDLERQIPLGWGFFLLQWINRYAVIPVFNFLEGFNLNYGIIILILTILLKLLLFPIARKTYVSSAKMRLLKPEVEEINARYPKKEDALKKQQATMDLYKKAGANPMSGCLPMLLQMPILFAMFKFFPASIELRQQPFLWAKDLSSYDSILNLPFNIPFYGDHVSLFTLLMTISTIIYTKINNDMMSSGQQQMPGMKTMMYIMPVMFLGFFNSFASGLSYYYLLTNLITFGQMWVLRKFVDEDKLHARIQENKKKPVKKSGFQQRLEAMAKQQQQQQQQLKGKKRK